MTSLLEQLRQSLPSQYEVEREIASGGMGTVYLARDTVLDRRVAIKVHRPELASSIAAKRLLEEARILARLNHPNVVSVHYAGEVGESFYYIMDYVEGETLEQRLARGPLTAEETLKLGDDLLRALEAVHEHGIVHRDIKPGNIFLVGDRALLGDFGVAKRSAGSSDSLTEPGGRVGTPGYMAPEQLTGGDVTPRTDAYSLAMVLYEALTGRQWLPLASASDADWSDVPGGVARTLQRALAWAPADRWPDAKAFHNNLTGNGRGSWVTRPRAIIASALVLALVAVGTWAAWRLLPTGPPPVSAARIAVLPFNVRGSGELAYLREGMVDLLSTKLDGAGDLRSADARAVLSLVAQEGGGVPDRDRARRIARDLGAGLYVLGSLVEVQGQLHLDAAVYDPDRGSDAVAEASAEGDASELFDLLDEVASELLVGRNQGPAERVTRIAAVTTSSLPALKAYLEGEQLYRAGHFLAAADALQRATEVDSTFALAWYRLATVADWLVRADLAEYSAERAFRHSGRLSEHDRRLFEASLAARRGDAFEAERLYRSILDTYPDDVEAWFELGEVLFHFGPFFGRPIVESRLPFERGLSFEPTEVHIVTHLIRIAAREGDHTALDSLVDRFLELNPDADRALEIGMIREYVLGDRSGQEQILSELRAADVDEQLVTAWSVPIFTKNLAAGDEVAAMLTDPSHAADIRALGHSYRAVLKVAQGKWTEAKVELEEAAALDPATGLLQRARFSTAPYLPTTPSELDSLRDELEGWDAAAVRSSAIRTTWVSVHDGAHRHLRLYLLGLLSARLGEDGMALQYAQELANLQGPDEVTALARDLVRGIRGQVAYGQGRVEDALAMLERIQLKTSYQRMSGSVFYSLAHERYTRATLLAESGRDREALAWFGSFSGGSVYDLAYLTLSHLRRGEIYERLGQIDEAVAHYSRFAELMRDCDPELRPLLERAQERLTALAGQGPV